VTASFQQLHEGACHCRGIGFLYRTALAPEDWPIRACQCGFCRVHAALSTSDPAGSLEFIEHSPTTMHRYRFGQMTTDFLLCRNCGAYIGATIRSEKGHFGIVNTRAMHTHTGQLVQAVPMNYEAESRTERLARRESRWTPISVV
jgi:hypothetical protein